MKTSDFSFDLPEELIAQYPSGERGQSRLLAMYRGEGRVEHRMVRDLPSLLERGTLIVFNNSRVRRARLIGVSEKTGGKSEFLLLGKLPDGAGEYSGRLWRAMVKRGGRRRTGSRYFFPERKAETYKVEIGGMVNIDEGVSGEIVGGEAEFRTVEFSRSIDDSWLDINGQIPLPPYIKRQAESEDGERYQTVYAREHGSAAAPTAGLHFTNELLEELGKAGIDTAYITLHVGLGTFLPVRAENVEDHIMHEETYSISEEAACKIERAKTEGRKVLAVGTTCVRTLESAWIDGRKDTNGNGGLPHLVKRGEGSTSIFIYPGYVFKAVDALFTNFHTPQSTLLMLVSAFAGRDFILDSYREAIKEGYRFFSYGDACLIQ